MKTRITESQKGNSVLVTVHEGYSTYTVVVPMPYAINFFLEGLVTSLSLVSQKKELQEKIDSKEGQKARIQERLRKVVRLFEQVLDQSGR